MSRKVARALHYQSGALQLGTIGDGQFVKRSGQLLVGTDAPGAADVGIEDVTGLQAALDAKSASGHNHDGTYAAVDHTHPGGGSALDAWPVGSVYIAVDSTSPATKFGGGTWAAFAAGRMLLGINAGDVDFDTAEETGGAKTSSALIAHTHVQDPHTHVQNAHTHVQDAHSHTIPVGATDDTSAPFDRADAGSNTGGANATTATGTAVAVNQSTTAVNQNATAVNQSAGSGASFSLMNPYIVVYMWKRTA